jgi:hypothetical protein
MCEIMKTKTCPYRNKRDKGYKREKRIGCKKMGEGAEKRITVNDNLIR